MVYHAIMNPESTGPHGGAAGQAWGIAYVIVLSAQTVARNAIDVRRSAAVITVTAQVIRTKRIDVEIDDSHAFLLSPLPVLRGTPKGSRGGVRARVLP